MWFYNYYLSSFQQISESKGLYYWCLVLWTITTLLTVLLWWTEAVVEIREFIRKPIIIQHLFSTTESMCEGFFFTKVIFVEINNIIFSILSTEANTWNFLLNADIMSKSHKYSTVWICLLGAGTSEAIHTRSINVKVNKTATL